MNAILRYSSPKQEFDYADRCFPDLEHRARYSIIMGHVYLESQLNSILEKIAIKNNNHALGWAINLGFKAKISLLLFNGVIKPDFHEKLKSINDARNAFAHEVWPSDTKFNGKSILEEGGVLEVRTAILEAYDALRILC